MRGEGRGANDQPLAPRLKERDMRVDYVLKRFGVFFLVLWLAATINFFGPRLTGKDPIATKMMQMAVSGGYVQQGINETIKVYNEKFGLDKPLWQQYVNYLVQMSHFDLGFSITNYPKTVKELMEVALPWTIGLLGVTTLLAFAVGSFLGALMTWPRAPRFIQYLLPPLLTLSAIPYYLLGLVLLYIFAFQTKLLPIFGGYTAGTIPSATPAFWLDILVHSILPALSILLAAIGFWALGMRAMMVTVQGEDYTIFAEAKGLKDRTLFMRYAVRNALLPQVTSLALALGHILSGAVLVEVVFSFPGIGTVLFHAISEFDYFTIQGIVFTIIVSIGLATLILDLIYPLLDPRITYRRA
jgi:peptide/nickel transport system permease protein